jgi:acyl-CoA thioester hydrolase
MAYVSWQRQEFPMFIDAPLRLHRATVKPEWLDYNGHMNEAYYVLVFSNATDAFMDFAGQDAGYRERTNTSIYTLESHVMYLQEVSEGEAVRIETQLLGHDEKRYRLFHGMYHAGSGELLATGEHMLVHVDMNGPKSAPFPPDIAARLAAIRAAHAGLPVPKQAGRAIALPGERR